MALKSAVLEHAQCGNLDIEKFFRYDVTQKVLAAKQQQHQGDEQVMKMEDGISNGDGDETLLGDLSVS